MLSWGEKHEWAIEKPKLHNATRGLRRTYFIDPEDVEVQRNPLKMLARKFWKHQWFPLCHARQARKVSMAWPVAELMISSLNLSCILEASESTRMRMEESLPKYHEDHIARRGVISLQHFNLVHKFIPMPQVMKIPAAQKQQLIKNGTNLEKIPAWDLTKSRK